MSLMSADHQPHAAEQPTADVLLVPDELPGNHAPPRNSAMR